MSQYVFGLSYIHINIYIYIFKITLKHSSAPICTCKTEKGNFAHFKSKITHICQVKNM